MRALKALALLVAALAALLAWQQWGQGDVASRLGTETDAIGERLTGVTSVHDGDTFRIGSERVRVLGMDAPEIGAGAKCANEQHMAVRSRDYLKSALRSTDVRIDRDGQDVYGRTLARVYVDGRDVADAMLAAGLAKPYVPRHHGDWC